MDISVLIPGIRTDLWLKVYNSMARAYTKGSWEIVFVGPEFPSNLSGAPNVKFINSYASPIVCRQMALCEAKGEWICYAADDCTFCDGAFDVAWDTLEKYHMNPEMAIVGKYLENVNEVILDNPLMRQDPYWSLFYHGGLHSILKPEMKEYFLINTGLVSTKMMRDIGGWDCQFEACAMACVDLSIRLQKYGVKCILQNEPIFKSTHLVGHAGDHGPIHDAQTQHDEPLFFQIWGRPEAAYRTVIELENWKHYPQRWERRFGKV